MTDLTPTEVSEIRKSLDSAIENVKNVIDLLQNSEMEIISLRERAERAERAERERDEFAKEFAVFVVGMEETATTEIPFSERVESHLEKFKYS